MKSPENMSTEELITALVALAGTARRYEMAVNTLMIYVNREHEGARLWDDIVAERSKELHDFIDIIL